MAGTLIDGLVADLAAEADELLAVVDGLPDERWETPTPAEGWSIRDQIAHLAHFDWAARTAIADPERFVVLRDRVGDLAELQRYVDAVGPANASRDGADMVAWWRAQNTALREAARAADPAVRVPWFGPPMSLASKVTARIMETWAHGQDVADALGVVREPTDRLAHVARIGVLAMPNAFRTHGLDVPETPIRVALKAPSGELWTWGPEDAADQLSGGALDFCLLVTQRRHVADTELEVSGAVASAWVAIAQAFAGPPGAGRVAGQFPKPARERP